MSKRRLSHQQLKRIKTSQTERQILAVDSEHAREGVVIAQHGKYADVKFKKKTHHCKLRQNLGAIVVGDKVVFQMDEKQNAVVTAIVPRTTKFFRLDERGQEKLIAANVTQVFIVMAPVPEPSWLLLDSYLAAIRCLNLPAIIVFNKMDLAEENHSDKLRIYAQLNVPTLQTSATQNKGLEKLKQNMQNQCSVFVGQSGVGKSSIIQKILPEADLEVGDLHERTGLGTHTTSTTKLYEMSGGGTVIDSPGIRGFNLWSMTALELSKAFVEFEPYLGLCKFRDCSHRHEPNCAIQAAVAEGKIASSRLQSYHILLDRFNNG